MLCVNAPPRHWRDGKKPTRDTVSGFFFNESSGENTVYINISGFPDIYIGQQKTNAIAVSVLYTLQSTLHPSPSTLPPSTLPVNPLRQPSPLSPPCTLYPSHSTIPPPLYPPPSNDPPLTSPLLPPPSTLPSLPTHSPSILSHFSDFWAIFFSTKENSS